MNVLESHSSCCDLLIRDHRETEALLQQIQIQIETGQDWAALQRLAQQLKDDLARHYACEEFALFPVLSQYRTMMLMEVEHDKLLSTEEDFYQALKSDPLDRAMVAQRFQQFEAQLKAHILEEEQGVFPYADRVLEPEESQMVGRKLAEVDTAIRCGRLAGTLHRPEPQWVFKAESLFETPKDRIRFNKCFEQDLTSLHHIVLPQGQRLKEHMSGQHQCLIVLEGAVQILNERSQLSLKAGQQVDIEPRLYISMEALEDSHLLLLKVWPKPHFLRQ